MVERGIRHCTIVAPDGDPQSPGSNDLNRVIERDHVVWRTALYVEICRGTTRLIRRRRFAFVLVGKARYFNIAELKLPNHTLENHQPVRALNSIVVEMSVGGKNYIDSEGWKLIQEPLWVEACWIVLPGIGENRQTSWRCDLECIVSVVLDFHIA